MLVKAGEWQALNNIQKQAVLRVFANKIKRKGA